LARFVQVSKYPESLPWSLFFCTKKVSIFVRLTKVNGNVELSKLFEKSADVNCSMLAPYSEGMVDDRKLSATLNNSNIEKATKMKEFFIFVRAADGCFENYNFSRIGERQRDGCTHVQKKKQFVLSATPM